MLSLLIGSVPVSWASASADENRAPDFDPATLETYTFPGEKAYSLYPGIEIGGVKYLVHYFTTGGFNQTNSRFIANFIDGAFLQNNAITGLLITADGVVVEDETVIRKVLALYRAAYYLYEYPNMNSLGYVDDEFVDEMRTLATITQFVTLSFPDTTATYAEALRLMFTSRLETPAELREFGQAVSHIAETGETIVDAVDYQLEISRFSNNKAVREAGKALSKSLVDWKLLPDQGRKVSLGGRMLNLSNGLKLISLGVDLLWRADLQKERATWMAHYQSFAGGNSALNVDQTLAANLVVAEVGDEWLQREAIIVTFVRDQAVDWLVDYAESEIIKEWVKSAWKNHGKRIVGHNVAGIASSVMMGLTIGTLLYGLEDVNECFWLGIHLDDYRRKFRDQRVELENRVRIQSVPYYSGELSDQYRSAYMLEALAAARMMSSYADGVDATVRDNLISFLNPIKWFKGKEWQEAAAELRRISVQTEQEAEDTLGHPIFITYAVESIQTRLVQVKLVVDDSSPRFIKSGPASNWKTMQSGFGGKSTFTYNEAVQVTNAGRWLLEVPEGLYQIEVYLPPPADSNLPPYSTVGVYTLYHFGKSIPIQRSLQQAQGGWLDLGTHYLEGSAAESIELVDLTSEPAGKTILVFDALRLTPRPVQASDFQSDPGLGLVYATGLPGETVTLTFAITNRGPMPWKQTGSYSFTPLHDPEGRLARVPIQQTVLPGETLELTVSVPIPSDSLGGIETIEYGIQGAGMSLEKSAKGYVIVLPPQLADYQEQLEQKIEEWKQQGEQAIEDLLQRILADIQRELARRAEEQLNNWISECLSPLMALGGLGVIIGWKRKKKR
jgi:hypothetical protein